MFNLYIKNNKKERLFMRSKKKKAIYYIAYTFNVLFLLGVFSIITLNAII
jgi:hypothetical protein